MSLIKEIYNPENAPIDQYCQAVSDAAFHARNLLGVEALAIELGIPIAKVEEYCDTHEDEDAEKDPGIRRITLGENRLAELAGLSEAEVEQYFDRAFNYLNIVPPARLARLLGFDAPARSQQQVAQWVAGVTSCWVAEPSGRVM